MAQFAIVENNVARLAGKAEVEAWAMVATGARHPFETIVRWPEAERNAMGIYTPQKVRPNLAIYEHYDNGTLAFQGGKVTLTYGKTNFDLTLFKTRRIELAWVKCDELIQDGTVTVQSDTAGTPVDHLFGTDEFSQKMCWSKTAKINAGKAANVVVTPKGELAGVLFTAAEFIDAADAVESKVDTLVKHYLMLKSTIMAANDHAAVAAIDIDTGWPT